MNERTQYCKTCVMLCANYERIRGFAVIAVDHVGSGHRREHRGFQRCRRRDAAPAHRTINRSNWLRRSPINTHNPQPSAICYPDFFDWRAQNHTLEHLVSYHDNLITLTGLERPIQVDAEIVSWDLLPALGVSPELGRGFTPDEEKAGTRVILISHALWTSQFGRSEAS